MNENEIDYIIEYLKQYLKKFLEIKSRFCHNPYSISIEQGTIKYLSTEDFSHKDQLENIINLLLELKYHPDSTNDLEVVKLLDLHKILDLQVSTENHPRFAKDLLVSYAAKKGLLQTIKYLHSKVDPAVIYNAMTLAFQYKHIKIIQYLHNNSITDPYKKSNHKNNSTSPQLKM
jgi:hypothetical protein